MAEDGLGCFESFDVRLLFGRAKASSPNASLGFGNLQSFKVGRFFME
jgi:hypothetical protein